MTEPDRDDRTEPIEDVVRGTVGDVDDETTRREALEQELEDRGRSDEGADVEVAQVLDAPAAGVVDDEDPDPPEPSEPG
jgi:hypothetical protein